MITLFPALVRNTNKPRILIVDDNPRFSQSARQILQQSGQYVVCEENHAASAVETARSFKLAAQIEADWACTKYQSYS